MHPLQKDGPGLQDLADLYPQPPPDQGGDEEGA